MSDHDKRLNDALNAAAFYGLTDCEVEVADLLALIAERDAQKAQPPCGADGAVPKGWRIARAESRNRGGGFVLVEERNGGAWTFFKSDTDGRGFIANFLDALASQSAAPVAPATGAS